MKANHNVVVCEPCNRYTVTNINTSKNESKSQLSALVKAGVETVTNINTSKNESKSQLTKLFTLFF